MTRPTDFRALIETLTAASVDFIVIGGIAAAVRGSARATLDLDVVYGRTNDNLERLTRALVPLTPYLRGAPPGLPFTLDEATLRRGLNFTLDTGLGALDLLGEVTGGGTFEQLEPFTTVIDLFDQPCRVVTLDKLIALKRAAGRPKDLEAVAELELLRDREP
jgi:hypothetical protein